MTTFEPPDATCDLDCDFLATAMPNDNVEILTPWPKDVVGATPMKAVFESVTVVLALLGVRLLVPFPLLR